jgi:hypothetical protein
VVSRIRTTKEARVCRAWAKLLIAAREVDEARKVNAEAKAEAETATDRAVQLASTLADHLMINPGGATFLSMAEARTIVQLYGVERARELGIPDSVIYTTAPRHIGTLDPGWLDRPATSSLPKSVTEP